MSEHLRWVDTPDYEEMSRLGAAFVLEELCRLPPMLLCVATGASPLGVYRRLVERFQTEPDLFRGMRVVKLDEWGPLGADDPASCEHYVRREIVEPLGVAPARYLTFAGDAADPEAECRYYARALNAIGPIDLCVLGMGANGHLGLNEPGDFLQDSVHVATLADSSRRHDMLARASTPVTHGLTLGMGDILRSRKILLLVFGASKRKTLAELMTGRISTHLPASLLWTHSDVTVLCDAEAHPEAG